MKFHFPQTNRNWRNREKECRKKKRKNPTRNFESSRIPWRFMRCILLARKFVDRFEDLSRSHSWTFSVIREVWGFILRAIWESVLPDDTLFLSLTLFSSIYLINRSHSDAKREQIRKRPLIVAYLNCGTFRNLIDNKPRGIVRHYGALKQINERVPPESEELALFIGIEDTRAMRPWQTKIYSPHFRMHWA